MSKKLLNEATIRRFQTLAAIPGLRESHGRGQYEGADYMSGREDLEEAKHDDEELDEMMDDNYDMSSLMEAEEEVEEEVEEAPADEDAEMDMGDIGDMGGMDEPAAGGAGDVEGALEKALKAMADVLAQELNVSIDVVTGGEEAEEMEEEPAAAAPAAPAAEAGGEEMEAMTENVRRLVNKVERRVKARIQQEVLNRTKARIKKETLEEALVKRVAARLLAAKKVEPKKPVAPVKKPAVPAKKK